MLQMMSAKHEFVIFKMEPASHARITENLNWGLAILKYLCEWTITTLTIILLLTCSQTIIFAGFDMSKRVPLGAENSTKAGVVGGADGLISDEEESVDVVESEMVCDARWVVLVIDLSWRIQFVSRAEFISLWILK